MLPECILGSSLHSTPWETKLSIFDSIMLFQCLITHCSHILAMWFLFVQPVQRTSQSQKQRKDQWNNINHQLTCYYWKHNFSLSVWCTGMQATDNKNNHKWPSVVLVTSCSLTHLHMGAALWECASAPSSHLRSGWAHRRRRSVKTQTKQKQV